MNLEPELELKHIYAGYGKKNILNGITLRLTKGDILALIGQNGAGKSTLLKVASGLLLPTSGEVWIFGTNVTKLALHDRMRLRVSYFMQGGRVFPSLSVKENLAIGLSTILSERRDENLSSILELFPLLKKNLIKRAGLLSGGERQVLALAMVLVRRPRLLVLDEPLAGVSPALSQEILQCIRNASSSWQVSVLIAEQNVRQALMLASRVCSLVNGRIAFESSNPESLLTTGQLDKLFMGEA